MENIQPDTNNRFPKTEKLNSKKIIEELFAKGSSFSLYPIRVVYIAHPNNSMTTHEVMFSVSKRYFKKAVTRNLLKRRMREAYRLNKHLSTTQGEDAIDPKCIAFIYTAKEPLEYTIIQDKLKLALLRFKNK